jgi:hypothetical protein
MNKMEMIIQKMVGVGKGKRQPENWKQNIRKRKRHTGSEYIGYKGETRHKREMKLMSKGL